MTITITHPEIRSHRTRGTVLTALVAVFVAIAGFAVVQSVTDGDSRPVGSQNSPA